MNPEENKEESKLNSKVKSLRTYQGDIDEILEKGKASASTILIAEQKRKDKDPTFIKEPVDTKFRNKSFIILGLTLLILGAVAVGAVYYMKSREQVAVIQKTKALIGFSQEKDLKIESLNKDQVISSILSEKQTFKLPPNSVLYVNTVDSQGDPVEISKLLTIIGPHMPSSLGRAFDKKYMVGIYSFDTNEPFIILTVSDYAESFSGMLKWERYIPADLGKLFAIEQNASTTVGLFSDESYKNKDLRILKSGDGRTLILYSFIDRNTLVITTNESIFSAILGKYLINKTVR